MHVTDVTEAPADAAGLGDLRQRQRGGEPGLDVILRVVADEFQ